MRTHVSSTGRHRSTSGQDVLGGVNVPVVPDAAARTRPVPGGEAESGEQVPARRACIGRGVPAVDHDQVAAVSGGLVLQLAAELPPPTVGNRFCQGPVTDHPCDVQVLDHDQVVVAGQPGAGLVQKVGTGDTDLGVRAGDLRFGLGPVVRPVRPSSRGAAGRPASGTPTGCRSPTDGRAGTCNAGSGRVRRRSSRTPCTGAAELAATGRWRPRTGSRGRRRVSARSGTGRSTRPALCSIGKRKEMVMSASRSALSRLRRAIPCGGWVPPGPEGPSYLRRFR